MSLNMRHAPQAVAVTRMLDQVDPTVQRRRRGRAAIRARETTARFLDDRVPVAKLRALRDDPAGFEPDDWRQGCELGWTSLLVSEARGGGSISGDGLADLTLIAYEFGQHAAPGPLLTTNM